MRFVLLSCVAIAALSLIFGRGFGDDAARANNSPPPSASPTTAQGAPAEQKDGGDHRAADLQQQVDGLQRVVSQVRQQIAQHKARKPPATNSGTQPWAHDALDQQAAELQRRDSKLHGELQPLIAQLEQQLQFEMRIPSSSGAAGQHELQVARDALRQAIADLRQQDGELQALIAGHEQGVGQREEQKPEAAPKIGEQQVARASPQSADTPPPQIADLQRQNDALQRQLAEQKRELAQSTQELAQLTHNLDAARAEVKRLGDRIETFRQQRQAAAQHAPPPTLPPQPPPQQQPMPPAVMPPTATEQLQAALQWLSGGRPDEARRVLVMAQPQMVLQSATPDQPVAQSHNRSATDVGEAIRWLDIGATGQAIQSITHAVQSSTGDGALPAPATPPARGKPNEKLAALQPIVPPAEPPPHRMAMVIPPVGAPPPPAADSGIFQDCPDCVRMVRIPAGTLMMGQGSKDPAAVPVHKVVLRSFALSQFPVTVADWNACHADSVCGPPPRMAAAQDDTPVHNVSWDDTQQFVSWISQRAGHAYRLPSEAEWEYAARADTATRYWWGDHPGVALANCAACGGQQDPHAPLPVSTYQPNPFGLYGMLGGVAQWVQDCWFPNYANAPVDGSARQSGSCIKRVLRGGSFRSNLEEIMPTARGNYDGPVRYLENGFRVARDLL